MKDRIGQVLLGTFRLDKVLGQGGYATAYLAHQTGLDRPAVVKIAHEHFLNSHESMIRARFDAEARAAARVSHPNLASIYGIGETSDGLPAMAMEFIDGWSLHGVLSRRAPFKTKIIEMMTSQLASALEAVHAARIIHRDVSPANILVQRSAVHPLGRFVLVDFGVAHIDEPTGQTFHPVGTPKYIAPEQMNGDSAPASDIYSLGAICWWALTGKEYHQSTAQQALHRSQPLSMAPDPLDFRQDSDPEVSALVRSMLSPLPTERPTPTDIVAFWKQREASGRVVSSSHAAPSWSPAPTGRPRSTAPVPLPAPSGGSIAGLRICVVHPAEARRRSLVRYLSSTGAMPVDGGSTISFAYELHSYDLLLVSENILGLTDAFTAVAAGQLPRIPTILMTESAHPATSVASDHRLTAVSLDRGMDDLIYALGAAANGAQESGAPAARHVVAEPSSEIPDIVFERFCGMMPEWLVSLDLAIAAMDRADISDIAGDVSTAAGMLNGFKLQSIADDLARLAQSSSAPTIQATYDALASEYSAFFQRIKHRGPRV